MENESQKLSLTEVIKEMCGNCSTKTNFKYVLYTLIVIALGNTYKELVEKIVLYVLNIK